MSNKKFQNRLTKSELEIIKKSFDLFDVNHTWKADIEEIKEKLLNIGYDQKDLVLFQLISDFDTPEAQKSGGISFFDLVEDINMKLLDKASKEV